MIEPINHPPAILCPNQCGSVLRLEFYFPSPYFMGSKTKCSSCDRTFDLWTYVVDLLRKKTKLFRNRGAAFIGARETWFTFQLPPNETRQINLANYGVPEDSKLIYLIFTPESGAGWPLEMQGNELLQHKTRHRMTFYGKPLPDSKECQSAKHNVNMCVTYIAKTIDQIPFEVLANAYEYFLEDNYQEMIMPSAVALEDAVKSLAKQPFKKHRITQQPRSQQTNFLENNPSTCCKTLFNSNT